MVVAVRTTTLLELGFACCGADGDGDDDDDDDGDECDGVGEMLRALGTRDTGTVTV